MTIAGDLRDRVQSHEHGLHARKAGPNEGPRSAGVPGNVGGLSRLVACVLVYYYLLLGQCKLIANSLNRFTVTLLLFNCWTDEGGRRIVGGR